MLSGLAFGRYPVLLSAGLLALFLRLKYSAAKI
jgi:hypothetical protein